MIKRLIYRIFGQPIPKDFGIRGTKSGKLYIDKKVFFKRKEVQDTIKSIQNSKAIQEALIKNS